MKTIRTNLFWLSLLSVCLMGLSLAVSAAADEDAGFSVNIPAAGPEQTTSGDEGDPPPSGDESEASQSEEHESSPEDEDLDEPSTSQAEESSPSQEGDLEDTQPDGVFIPLSQLDPNVDSYTVTLVRINGQWAMQTAEMQQPSTAQKVAFYLLTFLCFLICVCLATYLIDRLRHSKKPKPSRKSRNRRDTDSL